MDFEETNAQIDLISKQIEETKLKLETLPEGKLLIARNGNTYKWYNSNDGNVSYIPKRSISLAGQLAFKRHLQYRLDFLERKKLALIRYSHDSCHKLQSVNEEYCLQPEISHLLSNFYHFSKITSEELRLWSMEDFQSNPKHPEDLIHHTISGQFVRSKSEAMICSALTQHGIPFRYEALLTLSDEDFYPDFTLRHPINGRFFYWEHFGMMDSPPYYKNVYAKLQIYNRHGIIPGVNLITTWETSDHPLSEVTIQAMINLYFE